MTGTSGLENFELRVGRTDGHGLVLHADDHAHDAAGGQHFVAGFQVAHQRVEGFLTRALGADDDEIHHQAHDRDHTDEFHHLALGISLCSGRRGWSQGQ
jgi:hypothetical protein